LTESTDKTNLSEAEIVPSIVATAGDPASLLLASHYCVTLHRGHLGMVGGHTRGWGLTTMMTQGFSFMTVILK